MVSSQTKCLSNWNYVLQGGNHRKSSIHKSKSKYISYKLNIELTNANSQFSGSKSKIIIFEKQWYIINQYLGIFKTLFTDTGWRGCCLCRTPLKEPKPELHKWNSSKRTNKQTNGTPATEHHIASASFCLSRPAQAFPLEKLQSQVYLWLVGSEAQTHRDNLPCATVHMAPPCIGGSSKPPGSKANKYLTLN